MLRYILVAVIAYVTVELVQANEVSYTFNFKLPKVSADMVLKMKDKLKFKVIDTARKMEEECKYMKSLYEYGFTLQADQATGGFCSSVEDVKKIESYTETFRASMVKCFDEIDVTSGFDQIVDTVLSSVQTTDQTAKAAVDACSDDTCKTTAYKTLHNSINEIYKEKLPELRLAENEAIGKGLTGVAECMKPKVSDRLEEMMVATAKMQACMALGPSEAKEEAATGTSEAETKEDIETDTE